MIGEVVKYSEEEKNLVDDYTQRQNIQSNDWSDKKFEAIKSSIKSHYKEVQEYTCPYCKVKYPVKHGMAWDIEHIIPKDKKPQFMFEPLNLCVSCKDCNGAKGNEEVLVNKNRKTFPSASKDYKLVHPHFDQYEKHINAITPGDFYRPLSKKGEFTIITCRLLRFYGVVDREQPDIEIDELAKAMISSDGAARRVLEDELVKRIKLKREEAL
ncbi:HNH endonuclease [Photobacterium alginatilyticum]|uniref:HNH domain-containing protein n=1 Tax=Photobacterium alginatilyticum TaxID=1775171 RepID=A0ABW9YPC0_9GAMM|nr:HNH endonuclease [Photobacterium alginatilyticum]NBI55550.1 hypothetical protein [Photobacterium alginatilyticum]